jgi:phosphoglycerate dehydrogenase-like enzyme
MAARTLLVIGNPLVSHLRLLSRLPSATRITAGSTAEAHERAAPEADIVFCSGFARSVLETLWPLLTRLRWVHSLSAGVDGLLFPAFVQSPAPLTCSRGIFASSLAEFGLAGMLWFAKNLARLRRQQPEARWAQYEVEELRGHVVGIAGFGSVGRATAERARGFGMIGAAELARLKPSAVLLNLGRGPAVDQSALIEALRERRFRGAVLNVFDEEPLPPRHPLWTMEQVLLSPQCADHTATWRDDAMELFLDNFERFESGQPFKNIVDKVAGY